MGRRSTILPSARTDLLAIARSHFEKFGFAQSTVRAIASDASTSTHTLFHFWPTKDALYLEVYGHLPITSEEGARLRRELARLKAAVEPLIEALPQSSQEAQFALKSAQKALAEVGRPRRGYRVRA